MGIHQVTTNKTGESKRKWATKTLDIAQVFRKESSVSTTTTFAGVSDSNESLPDTAILTPDEAGDSVTIISASKSYLNEVNQPPSFTNHSDSQQAESQSPELFSQEVSNDTFRKEVGSQSPQILFQEHIELVGSKRREDTGDKLVCGKC